MSHGYHRKWERRERLLKQVDEFGYATCEGNWMGHPSIITVGLTRLQHPELMFPHMEVPVVEYLAEACFALITEGWVFRHGDLVEGLVPHYPLAMISIPKWAYFDVLTDCYPSPTPRVLQVVSPDRGSLFPWDSGSEIAELWHAKPVPDTWTVRHIGHEPNEVTVPDTD